MSATCKRGGREFSLRRDGWLALDAATGSCCAAEGPTTAANTMVLLLLAMHALHGRRRSSTLLLPVQGLRGSSGAAKACAGWLTDCQRISKKIVKQLRKFGIRFDGLEYDNDLANTERLRIVMYDVIMLLRAHPLPTAHEHRRSQAADALGPFDPHCETSEVLVQTG